LQHTRVQDIHKSELHDKLELKKENLVHNESNAMLCLPPVRDQENEYYPTCPMTERGHHEDRRPAKWMLLKCQRDIFSKPITVSTITKLSCIPDFL
jgi:hypothetical protein